MIVVIKYCKLRISWFSERLDKGFDKGFERALQEYKEVKVLGGEWRKGLYWKGPYFVASNISESASNISESAFEQWTTGRESHYRYCFVKAPIL